MSSAPAAPRTAGKACGTCAQSLGVKACSLTGVCDGCAVWDRGPVVPLSQTEETKTTTAKKRKTAMKFTRQSLTHQGRVPDDGLTRSCVNCSTTTGRPWRRSKLAETAGKWLCQQCGSYERACSRPRPEKLYRPSQNDLTLSCANCSTTTTHGRWHRSNLPETAGKRPCNNCGTYEIKYSRPCPDQPNERAPLASATSPSHSVPGAQSQQNAVTDSQDHPWTAARLPPTDSSQTPAPFPETPDHAQGESSPPSPLRSLPLRRIPPPKRVVVPHIDDASLDDPPTPIVFQALSLLLADLRRLLCTPHEEHPFHFRARVIRVAWALIRETPISFKLVFPSCVDALAVHESPGSRLALATTESYAIWMGAPPDPRLAEATLPRPSSRTIPVRCRAGFKGSALSWDCAIARLLDGQHNYVWYPPPLPAVLPLAIQVDDGYVGKGQADAPVKLSGRWET
ncbi:hypothetical protein FB451DRAFT_1478255 [Mycena latifolia]|nr:hypothetical protein FB451DRAFT_1478255 [Mycena latifolia]